MALGVFAFLAAVAPSLQVAAIARLSTLGPGDRPNNGTLAITLVVGAMALLVLSTEMVDFLAQLASRRLVTRVMERIAGRLAALSEQEIRNPEVLDAARGSREAVWGFLLWYLRALINLASGVVTLVFLFVALWPLSRVAALLLLLALLISLPVSSRIARLEAEMFPRTVAIERESSYFLDQLLYQRSALDIIQFRTGPRLARWVGAKQERIFEIHRRFIRHSSFLKGAGGVASVILTGVGLWVIVAVNGGSAAQVAAGIVAVMAGASSSMAVGDSVGTVMTSAGPLGQLRDFLDAGASERRTARREDVDTLSCCDLTYTYPGAEAPALRGVSFSLRRGEVLGLVGLNGAGKSTLLGCISGQLETPPGMVTMTTHSGQNVDPASGSADIAVMSQDFGRYEFTVREAIAMGSVEPATDRQIWDVLGLAHAAQFVAEAGGLDTQLGEQWGGTGLSGGQWQRLALARAYLSGASFMLLDEPTSSVDSVTEEKILANILARGGDRMTILVTHRAWTLKQADRILVIHDGRVVESGGYDELLANGGHFAELFEGQRL